MARILIVDGQRNIGGGQIMTLRICKHLSPNHQVAVAIPGGPSDVAKLLGDFQQFYFPHKPYNRGRKSIGDVFRFASNFLSARKAIRKAIKSYRPDLIYAQNSIVSPYVVAASRGLGIPVVSHLHVYHTDTKSVSLMNHFLAKEEVKAIYGVSQYTLSQLSQSLRPKFRLLYNYVETNPNAQPRNLPTGNAVVASVGDVCADKGQHLLFEAVAKSGLSPQVRIAGAIVDQAYREQIESSGYRFHYSFEGRVANAAGWLKDIDLLTTASKSETFSLAMVEAWSWGIPTLSSKGSGMQEIVETFLPEYSELMLFERENKQGFADKLKRLLTDEKLYLQISEKVLSVSREHLGENIFAENINEYICNILTRTK